MKISDGWNLEYFDTFYNDRNYTNDLSNTDDKCTHMGISNSNNCLEHWLEDNWLDNVENNSIHPPLFQIHPDVFESGVFRAARKI